MQFHEPFEDLTYVSWVRSFVFRLCYLTASHNRVIRCSIQFLFNLSLNTFVLLLSVLWLAHSLSKYWACILCQALFLNGTMAIIVIFHRPLSLLLYYGINFLCSVCKLDSLRSPTKRIVSLKEIFELFHSGFEDLDIKYCKHCSGPLWIRVCGIPVNQILIDICSWECARWTVDYNCGTDSNSTGVFSFVLYYKKIDFQQ